MPVVAGCVDDDTSAKCLANFADWTEGFKTTPPTVVELGLPAPRNGFLAGGTAALDETGLTVTNDNSGSLNLNSATFDGRPIGKNQIDGVAFFTAQQDNVDFYYAGLLSGTNLGAPLGAPPEGELTKALWSGRFSAIERNLAQVGSQQQFTETETNLVETDFVLEVDFDTAERSIIAFINPRNIFSKDGVYLLTGTYDENGVITGTVVRSTTVGVLTGLIGAEGAVGAFISGTGDKDLIIEGFDRGGFTGGFVASPTATLNPAVVNFNDWTNSFITPLPTGYRENTNSFFAGRQTAIGSQDSGNLIAAFLNMQTATDSDGLAFGGDVADGVEFFNLGAPRGIERKSYYYAALFSGTDLGAPLTQTNGTARWNAVLAFGSDVILNASVRGPDAIRGESFILNVTFGESGNGRIDATLPSFTSNGGEDLTISATYDARGIISGTVDNGPAYTIVTSTGLKNGYSGGGLAVLTGLIGEQGAVGAFVAGRGRKDQIVGTQELSASWAGAFVAIAPSYRKIVNFNDWTNSFTNPAPTSANVSITTTPTNQFLAGNATTLDDARLTDVTKQSLTLGNATFGAIPNGVDGNGDPILFGGDLEGDAKDGVAFMQASNNTAIHFYSGILADTNLGAPLTETSGTADWQGQFTALGIAISEDFTLEINFGTQKIETFIPRGGTDNEFYHLKGDYSDSGVITGTVDYGQFSDINARTPATTGRRFGGILTGLIGQDGAVGAFVSGKGNQNAITDGTGAGGYAGGFVACPYDSVNNRCQQ